jgi:hypothetical protein
MGTGFLEEELWGRRSLVPAPRPSTSLSPLTVSGALLVSPMPMRSLLALRLDKTKQWCVMLSPSHPVHLAIHMDLGCLPTLGIN